MQKKNLFRGFILLALLFTSTLLVNSCKENEPDVITITGPGGTPNGSDTTALVSIVSGQVISELTGIPLDSAIVRIVSTDIDIGLFTDNQGKFSTEIETDVNLNLTITTFKPGYITDTLVITMVAGNDLVVPLIKLKDNSSAIIPSGDPVTIFLAAQTTAIIGVKESGSVETAQLIFEVQDSAGVPVDLDHSVDVYFRMGSAPGGGEVLSPAVVKTNDLGQATVNLTSGTKAGVVQIIGEIFLDTKTITSLPVAISIHGGLPDLEHFSIAPAMYNFPGYNIFGLLDPISAYVGDKYANPVRPNTTVYFTSTGGIIEGSAQTNDQGIGTVNLISAYPQPFHNEFGAGFATITASTADENQQTISRDIVVLFSGIPGISISPTGFNISNGGSQSFSYIVSDQNGNPLAGGTNITVTIDGESVEGQGDLSVTLPDTQSPFWTQFGFLVYDNDIETDEAKPVTIRITSTGPNGEAFLTISGTSH